MLHISLVWSIFPCVSLSPFLSRMFTQLRFYFKLYCTYRAFSCNCFYSFICLFIVKWWWSSIPRGFFYPPPLPCQIWCHAWFEWHSTFFTCARALHRCNFSFQLTTQSLCIARILNPGFFLPLCHSIFHSFTSLKWPPQHGNFKTATLNKKNWDFFFL